MKNLILILFSIVLVASVSVYHVNGAGIGVTLTMHDAYEQDYFVDDEKTTVRKIAEQYLESQAINPKQQNLRVESHFGFTYPLDLTLKEAGITNGSVLKIKMWSFISDVGAHFLNPFKRLLENKKV